MLRDVLEKTDGLEGFLQVIRETCERSKELVVFGAGIGGEKAAVFLKENKMWNKVKGFSDNNVGKIRNGLF